ncbi:MAG: hypothetical protein AAF710_05505 [Planctomycetota bacterium]
MTWTDTTAGLLPVPGTRLRPLQTETKPNWRRIDLEMSIKPFARYGAEAYPDTARRVLKTWEKLIDRADEVAALIWVGDSTDLMTWSGDPDQPLVWCSQEGFCNLGRKGEPYFPGWFEGRPPVPYLDERPRLTYTDLRDIVAALKEAAAELYGIEFHAGIPYDPTPEFAESPFKYDEHVEILHDHPEGPRRYSQRFVSHQKTFHADPRPFAGFPSGIPEGTTVGTFLGRQTKQFAADFGFDYLWLSNGFGYSHYAWHINGTVLETDGRWYPERVPEQLALLERFWIDFRRECPELPIEFRGTNWPVGHDLSTDAASHTLVQRLSSSDVSPPNVPVLYAELLAMDVTTYLTRMAGATTDRIIYRAYLNDPWHEHNPWFDIYNRQAFETLSCTACARLRADGGLDVPTDLHILTTDTERGEMPQDQVNEAVPGYLRALEERADRPGPVVWVYPFRDLHRVLENRPGRLPQVFNVDHFMWRSIEAGTPVNTVVEADDFTTLVASGRADTQTIFIAPTPAIDGRYADALLTHAQHGGTVVFYGPLDHASGDLLDALRVTLADELLGGDFRVSRPISEDLFESRADLATLPLRHHPSTGGGGVRETGDRLTDDDIMLEQSGRQRVWARCLRNFGDRGGAIGWVRGTLPFDTDFEPPYLRPKLDPADRFQRPQDATRHLIARLTRGRDNAWELRQTRAEPGTEPIRLFIKRHRGAFYFAGSKPDTSSGFRVRTGDGAPLFTGLTTPVRRGFACDSSSKTIYREARVFVTPSDTARDRRYTVRNHSFGLNQSRALAVEGLDDDRIVVYPDPAALREGRVSLTDAPYADRGLSPSELTGVNLPHRIDGERVVIDRHTGPLFIKW